MLDEATQSEVTPRDVHHVANVLRSTPPRPSGLSQIGGQIRKGLMVWSLSRWRPRHLLLSWLTYWVGLAGVTLGPAIPAILRATSADGKGSISASYGDNGMNVTVLADGATAWSGAASLTAIALWIVGPPLLLWLVWFVRRKPRDEQLTPPGGLSAPNARGLSEGAAERLDVRQRQRDPASRA